MARLVLQQFAGQYASQKEFRVIDRLRLTRNLADLVKNSATCSKWGAIMKKLNSLMAFVTTLALLLVPFCTPLLQASPAPPTATPYVSPWPRAFDRNGAHVIVYQPQVKSWRGYRSLIADTAGIHPTR